MMSKRSRNNGKDGPQKRGLKEARKRKHFGLFGLVKMLPLACAYGLRAAPRTEASIARCARRQCEAPVVQPVPASRIRRCQSAAHDAVDARGHRAFAAPGTQNKKKAKLLAEAGARSIQKGLPRRLLTLP